MLAIFLLGTWFFWLVFSSTYIEGKKNWINCTEEIDRVIRKLLFAAFEFLNNIENRNSPFQYLEIVAQFTLESTSWYENDKGSQIFKCIFSTSESILS